MFNDWESQLFWFVLSAVLIPVVVYFFGVCRDRRLFLVTLSKVDCAPYLFYFSLYYDFLAQFARGADRPVTSEFALISFQNMSGHLLSLISSMRNGLADAAKYVHGVQLPGVESSEEKTIDKLINHLDVLHVVLRTHEVSIVGRAAVFPGEALYDPRMVAEITLDQIKLPVEEIAKLIGERRNYAARAGELKAALQTFSSPMDTNISQQKTGYAELVRWISDNMKTASATKNVHV